MTAHVTKIDMSRNAEDTVIADVTCSCKWTKRVAGRDEYFVRRAAAAAALAHREANR